MRRKIGFTELLRKYRPFFDQVVEDNVLDDFDRAWQRLAEANADTTVDEVAADIEAARQG